MDAAHDGVAGELVVQKCPQAHAKGAGYLLQGTDARIDGVAFKLLQVALVQAGILGQGFEVDLALFAKGTDTRTDGTGSGHGRLLAVSPAQR